MSYSSTQISGLVGGQLAMFGNNASYARQISPGNDSTPTFTNPFPQNGGFTQGQGATAGAFNAIGSYGVPVMQGAGMMMGGRAGGMLDPTTAAMSSMGRSLGYRGGAGMASNAGTMMSSVGRLGFGGMARAGAFAGAAAAPALIGAQAVKYVSGQMMEGAQFQGQTNQVLQDNFRFTNQASRTGQGFGQSGQTGMGQMLHSMGTEDIQSTPQEMLKLVSGGAQMGVFRGVQDAKEFKRKFTEMKNSLKEIASTFNTTLEESMPFFQAARQQGFWTPQDITRHAQQVRSVQSNTGMSAQQAQAVMGVGASMVRSIGGTGQQGASMMAKAQGMAGAALYGGTVTSQQLGDAGMGTGEQGAQNLGQMLAGSSARFAKSRVGRWVMASMMNKQGGLDEGSMRAFGAGGVSIGQIGARARQNVGGRRAYQFVQNEEQMRGQFAEQGPQGVMGIVKSLAGGRLYGKGSKDKLITSRIIKRFLGGSKKQREIIANMMRDMPRTMEIQAARSESSMDVQQRQGDEALQHTFDGMKRRMGQWWRERVDGPMQRAGALLSQRVGKTWQKFTDRIFGTTGRGLGISDEFVRGMARAAETGDRSHIQDVGGSQLMNNMQQMGDAMSGGVQVGQQNSEVMQRLGYKPRDSGMNRLRRGGEAFGWASAVGGLEPMTLLAQKIMGRGQGFEREDAEDFENLSSAMGGRVGGGEARALGFGGTKDLIEARKGAGAQGIQAFLRSSSVVALRQRLGDPNGNMNDKQRQSYGNFITEMVKQGAAGQEAQDLIAGASNPRQALGRVMAAQGGTRGESTGIGGAFGGGGRVDQMSREALSDHRDNMAEALAEAARGGVSDQIFSLDQLNPVNQSKVLEAGGENITAESAEQLRDHPVGAAAMKLFAIADAEPNKDKAERIRAMARKKLKGLVLDKDSGLPKGAKDLAGKLVNKNDPDSENLARAAGRVGVGETAKDKKLFEQRVRSRRKRMVDKLGDDADKMFINAGEGLGGALSAAMDTSTRESRGSYIEDMEKVVSEAMADPDKAGEALAMLEKKGLGGTDVAVSLSRSIDVVGDAKKMGLKRDLGVGQTSKRAERGVRAMLEKTQKGLTKNLNIDELIKGQGKSISVLRKRLMRDRNYTKENVDEMLGQLQGGLTTQEYRKRGAGLAVRASARTHSETVAQESGLEPGAALHLTGKEGTMRGVEEQLKVHTHLFKEMNANLDTIAKKEKKKRGSKKDPE